MKIVNFILFILITFAVCQAHAESEICLPADEVCKEFEELSDRGADEAIIAMAKEEEKYTDGALFYICLAYDVVASEHYDKNPEEAEKLYLRSLAFGCNESYWALFLLRKDRKKSDAYEMLSKYLSTNPDDPDPYYFLGEHKYEEENYEEADRLLRLAKRYSKKHTAGIDWLLFKVNYLLGNYADSLKYFEEAIAQSRFSDEIEKVKRDPRFSEITNIKEFRDYKNVFK